MVVDTAEVTASATVTMSDQQTDGSTVVVDWTELADGGFIAVHDSSLLDGATLDSVVGVSGYLGSGVHKDVRVELDDELDEENTLIPMPHRDTNDNEQYDFVDSNGSEDGPFVNADGGAVVDTATVTPSDRASVSMNDTTTGGNFVVVDEAFLPEGGFVTIHDSTVLDGEIVGSIRGTSDYLGAGTHSGVHITLDAPLDEGDTLVPMAHRDTNDNEQYDFPDTDGEEDGPYTTDEGDPVVDTADASVSAAVSTGDYESDGNSYTVHHVDLSEGGFVTIHDATLFDDAVFDSVIGTSEYLEAGFHADIEVVLDEPMRTSQTVVPMAHRDTNDNEQYDFVTSEGEEDGPYTTEGGDPVVDTARSSVVAQATFTGEEEVGDSVTVDSVTLHDGGFVTLHDSTLLDGEVVGSVRGTSDYLGPGTHSGVEVEIDEVPGGEDTFVAMPHLDTNGNQEYDFVSEEGAADGPYTVNGAPHVVPAMVTAEATANVSISDQSSDGSTVTVDSATLSQGGFVTIHDGTLLDGEVIGSVRGTSDYLKAGSHEDVEISLDDPYESDGTAIAMAHLDSNDNEGYDFVDTEGDEDGPYVTDGGDPVLDDAALTVEMDDGMEDTETNNGGSDGDGAGFGAVVALVAVVASVLAARRLN
ncbi:PGF-CTERM sorting domain-containing protein [Halobacteriales archaeon QS_9_68_42]|nr:MAG: PGF-CTERM sorting domain-containing protein [Halobacteriales archaeon QS_9_68_42]